MPLAEGGGQPPRTPTSTNASPPEKAGRERLTTKEAAHYLRLSARTLERYRVEGTGPAFLKLGPGKRARVFYLRDQLEAWLLERNHSSTAEYRKL